MCSQFRPGAQDLATQRGGAGLGAVRVGSQTWVGGRRPGKGAGGGGGLGIMRGGQLS